MLSRSTVFFYCDYLSIAQIQGRIQSLKFRAIQTRRLTLYLLSGKSLLSSTVSTALNRIFPSRTTLMASLHLLSGNSWIQGLMSLAATRSSISLISETGPMAEPTVMK